MTIISQLTENVQSIKISSIQKKNGSNGLTITANIWDLYEHMWHN